MQSECRPTSVLFPVVKFDREGNDGFPACKTQLPISVDDPQPT